MTLKCLLLGYLFLTTTLDADSMRCGHRVISHGETIEMLQQKCGKPRKKDFVQDWIQTEGSLKKVRLQRWHYRLGEGRLAREVMIYKDEVYAIRTGSR